MTTAESLIQKRRMRDYAEGVKDGIMTITLQLMLGIDSHGGVVYDGEIPDDLRVYLEAALRRASA